MQRGGRIPDTSDRSAGRLGGRNATRAAQQASAVKEQDMYLSGDEYADDDATSGVDYPEEVEDGCGYSYEHTLRFVGERDGISTWLCQECDAEIIEGEEVESDGSDES